MSRVINPESGARRRTKLVKQMGQALRDGAGGAVEDETQRDIFAFLALSLKEICRSVDETVSAWEKRDYWVKADKFRMEWIWAERASRVMAAALAAEDLTACRDEAARIAGQIVGVKIPKRAPRVQPWAGAWRAWSDEASGANVGRRLP